MEKTIMFIKDNKTDEVFCHDRKWRKRPDLGTKARCAKTWKMYKCACRMLDKLHHRQPDREVVLIKIPNIDHENTQSILGEVL